MAEHYSAEKEWLDYRAALICAVLANCHRTKRGKTFKPADFMPKQKQDQTPEQMKYSLMVAAKALEKGKFKVKNNH